MIENNEIDLNVDKENKLEKQKSTESQQWKKQDEEELVEWIKQNSTIYDKHLKGYKYNQSILDQGFEYQYLSNVYVQYHYVFF